VCYYSVCGRLRVEFSAFGRQLFVFISTRIIESALDKPTLEEGLLYCSKRLLLVAFEMAHPVVKI
jgi:hypothetical protein